MYLFIYDEIMLREVQDKMKLPMTFVTFALLEDYKMIDYKKRPTIVPKNFVKRGRGGNRIFGTIWKLEESSFYIRILDAYYACSLSRIYENNLNDRTHRLTLKTYPFYVDSVSDLVDENFYTFKPINCQVWIANQNDDNLIRRINRNRHKIQNGCVLNYLQKCMEREMLNGNT